MSAKKQLRAPRKRPARKLPKPLTQDFRLFSEQEREEFLSRNDYTGFKYFKVARMREKKHLSPKQKETLAKHEEVETLIQRDPEAVLRKVYQAIDEGEELLLRLIHSRKLLHAEVGWQTDQAVDCFVSRLRSMNEQLVQLAEIRAPGACAALWFEAKQLTEAVVRLAVAYPEEFRPSAESSLTMPSLRARLPEFSCDAPTIAKAIHLAEKHPAPDISDNRSRMGALCHCLVAHIVDEIESVRRRKEHFERTAKYKKSFSLFLESDVIDLPGLATKLRQASDTVSSYLRKRLSRTTRQLLARHEASASPPAPLQAALVEDFNKIVRAQSIYEARRFSGVALRPVTQRLLLENPQGDNLGRFNRLLLEDAYPLELSSGLTKSDKIIPDFYQPSVRRHFEACWKLEDLRGKADAWWNGRVKDMLKGEFERMQKNSTHNPGLWEELTGATDGGTEKEKWRVLEKNCRNKLIQIAGENLPRT